MKMTGVERAGLVAEEQGVAWWVGSSAEVVYQGGSRPHTLSAMKYMASANCSGFSLPDRSVSHRFLRGRYTTGYIQEFLGHFAL